MYKLLYYIINIILDSYKTLINLLPYLLLGTLFGEALKYSKLNKWIIKALNSRASIVFAAIVGIISPLCTFGTVPVVIELYQSGALLSPLLTFLICSSMMNPQLFVMTWGGIDPEFAVWRIIMVFIFGVTVGVIAYILPSKWIINKNLGASDKLYLSAKYTAIRAFSWRKFFKGAANSLEFTGFYIVIGILAGSIIKIVVPGSFLQNLFIKNDIMSILLISLVSIPTYVCGGGVIPLISSLIDSGMSKGAAAAFFNVGSVTRMPALMALASIIRPLFIVFYIVLLMVFSLAAGVFYH